MITIAPERLHRWPQWREGPPAAPSRFRVPEPSEWPAASTSLLICQADREGRSIVSRVIYYNARRVSAELRPLSSASSSPHTPPIPTQTRPAVKFLYYGLFGPTGLGTYRSTSNIAEIHTFERLNAITSSISALYHYTTR